MTKTLGDDLFRQAKQRAKNKSKASTIWRIDENGDDKWLIGFLGEAAICEELCIEMPNIDDSRTQYDESTHCFDFLYNGKRIESKSIPPGQPASNLLVVFEQNGLVRQLKADIYTLTKIHKITDESCEYEIIGCASREQVENSGVYQFKTLCYLVPPKQLLSISNIK